jgi:disulfide oxidoreductase YuzD
VREPRGEAGHDGRPADPQRDEVRDLPRGLRADRGLGVLPMVRSVRVAIVGAPVSCGPEVKDVWRELSGWVAGQLDRRYGDAVRVEYYDLFDPRCPPMPPDAQLPLVMLNGEVLTSGGKLSLPMIRRAVEALGVRPRASGQGSTDGVSARATAESAPGTSR